MRKGVGSLLMSSERETHQIQTPNLPTAVSGVFLCTGTVTVCCPLAQRGTCLGPDSRPIPASCSATCQRVCGSICVLKGGKAQAEARMCLVTTFSPATLKLTLYIRWRTRHFPKKGTERLRYPCIFCLLQTIDNKPNNVFKAVLLGVVVWGIETEQAVGHDREGKWLFSEGMSSTSQKLPLPSGTSQLEQF